jgi:hypothetical protein
LITEVFLSFSWSYRSVLRIPGARWTPRSNVSWAASRTSNESSMNEWSGSRTGGRPVILQVRIAHRISVNVQQRLKHWIVSVRMQKSLASFCSFPYNTIQYFLIWLNLI